MTSLISCLTCSHHTLRPYHIVPWHTRTCYPMFLKTLNPSPQKMVSYLVLLNHSKANLGISSLGSLAESTPRSGQIIRSLLQDVPGPGVATSQHLAHSAVHHQVRTGVPRGTGTRPWCTVDSTVVSTIQNALPNFFNTCKSSMNSGINLIFGQGVSMKHILMPFTLWLYLRHQCHDIHPDEGTISMEQANKEVVSWQHWKEITVCRDT